MECFNCGNTLDEQDQCGYCGIDVSVYKKIIRLSNHYYNTGLEKASVRDLSGAVAALKKSVKCNKKNMDARNLLGLVYNEMGETVKAIGEWVISKSMNSADDNIASEYLNSIQSNQNKLNEVNQTIKKYNQALVYCKQDSRDLAIIQLKKVLSLNPKLIQAYQLLALIYIKQNEWEKARKLLNTALKIDTNNTTTLRYLQEIKGEKGYSKKELSKKKSEKVSYSSSGNDIVIQPTKFREFSGLSSIVNIVLGVIIGLGVCWFLIVPALNSSKNSDASEALVAANEQIASKNAEISDLEEEVETAEAAEKDAKTSEEASQNIISSYEQFVVGLYNHIGENDTDALTALNSVDSSSFSDTTKTIYDTIVTTVTDELVGTAYSDGISAFNRSSYQTAISNLSEVIAVAESYDNGNALYVLAEAYENNEQTAEAITYYQKVIDLNLNADQIAASQVAISELQAAETAE